MQAEVRTTEDGIEVVADTEWLSRPALRHAVAWAEEKDLVAGAPAAADRVVRLPGAELERLGKGPTFEEAEVLDLWASEHEAEI
ncbi:MAG: hypothetical protein RLZZ450_712 [Pseudomonadota bacterium]|jgi:hypothetical protein